MCFNKQTVLDIYLTLPPVVINATNLRVQVSWHLWTELPWREKKEAWGTWSGPSHEIWMTREERKILQRTGRKKTTPNPENRNEHILVTVCQLLCQVLHSVWRHLIWSSFSDVERGVHLCFTDRDSPRGQKFSVATAALSDTVRTQRN